jgi:hypothetical protein
VEGIAMVDIILKAVVVAIFAGPFVCAGLLIVVTVREMFTWSDTYK